MNWYYAIASDRRGPVDQQQFDTLVRQGVITHQTLVWREGMSDWQAYSAVAPGVAPVLAGGPPMAGFEACGLCGTAMPSGDMVTISERKYCAACKPIVVQRIKEGVAITTDAEDIRRQYIKHEASVKSIGILYYLGAFGLLVGGGSAIFVVGAEARPDSSTGIMYGLAMLAGCALVAFIGRGYRKLKSWVRIPTAIFSGLGLLSFPIGTIIHGYILYIVFNQKGKMVLSQEYKAIIEQTPQVKYKSSSIMVALLLIIVAVILIAVIAALMSNRR